MCRKVCPLCAAAGCLKSARCRLRWSCRQSCFACCVGGKKGMAQRVGQPGKNKLRRIRIRIWRIFNRGPYIDARGEKFYWAYAIFWNPAGEIYGGGSWQATKSENNVFLNLAEISAVGKQLSISRPLSYFECCGLMYAGFYQGVRRISHMKMLKENASWRLGLQCGNGVF